MRGTKLHQKRRGINKVRGLLSLLHFLASALPTHSHNIASAFWAVWICITSLIRKGKTPTLGTLRRWMAFGHGNKCKNISIYSF